LHFFACLLHSFECQWKTSLNRCVSEWHQARTEKPRKQAKFFHFLVLPDDMNHCMADRIRNWETETVILSGCSTGVINLASDIAFDD
jgi:hypothetical protein